MIFFLTYNLLQWCRRQVNTTPAFKSELHGAVVLLAYISGSQTVRRDAPVRRFNFPKASRNILVLCH